MRDRPRVLVTGGGGFIGSHLVDHRLDDGHEVIVLDDPSPGWMENVSRAMERDARVEQTDLTDFEEIDRFVRNVDGGFRPAAFAGIVPSNRQPLRYHQPNVNGTASSGLAKCWMAGSPTLA